MSKVAIFKDTAIYSVSTFVSQGLTVVLAIYIRNQLGPEAMGVWALLQIYLVYIAYFNLGIFGAVYREIPILRGAGKEEKIVSLKNSAFSYVAISSTVASLLLVIGTFLFREKLSDPFFYGLLSLAVSNVLQRANNYQIKILITDKKFSLISQFNLFSALSNFILVLFSVWFYKLYGLYLATVFTYFLNYIYLRYRANLKFCFQWRKDEIRDLIRFGLPLVGLGLVTKLFYSLDKLIIVKFLGLSQLGIYTIATMAMSYMMVLPNMFHVVIYPRILERFGDAKDREGQKKYSTMPVKFISLYFSFALGFIWILGPYLCHLFLPKFVSGVPALKALIIGGCFLSLFEQMNTILLGHKRHLWTIPWMLGLSGIMFGIDAYFIGKGWGLLEVASLSSAIYLTVYAAAAFMAWGPIFGRFKIVKELFQVLFPIFINVFILSILDKIWGEVTVVSLLIKMSIYFGVLIFSLRFLDRYFGERMSLVALVQEVFRELKGGRISSNQGKQEESSLVQKESL
ncbi:MAG: oligosaccharide flippase family protein [Deltaproteobacteria bacterium]